jgi:hypothetical protein
MKTYNKNQYIARSVVITTPIVKTCALIGRGICIYLATSRELRDAVIALSILTSICGVCLLTLYSAFGII